MAKQQILGNYNIIAEFTGAFSNPVIFENNNRNKSIISFDETFLNFQCMNSPNAGGFIYLYKKNKTFVKRARIITKGAEKLRSGLNTPFAVEINIKDRGPLDTASTDLQNFILKFPKFNEWTDFNLVFEPYKRKGDNDELVYLETNNVHVNFDDYNIQSAYIGQPIKFFIELEIDTLGVDNAGRIF